MTSFTDAIAKHLADAGLVGAVLVTSSPVSQSFADTEAVFRLAGLRLRFVRDRGQVFLDITSDAKPEEFSAFDDVEIAMGWQTIDEVIERGEPQELGAVLARLRANLDVLSKAFSDDRQQATRELIDQSARERGRAFVNRIQGRT